MPCAQVPFGGSDPEAEFQPQLAVHPDTPNRLAVVWTQGLFLSAMVGLSDDGGETWQQVHVPISRCSGGDGGWVGDPWIVWGPHDTLHIAALTGTQFGVGGSNVVVTRSVDGGNSWSAPVVVENDGQMNDRGSLAVDPNDPQRLYLAWTKTLGDCTWALALADSSDGGQTWSAPRLIHSAPEGSWPSGLSVEVLPDGNVLVAFEQLDDTRCEGDSDAHELVLRSPDRGATWTLVTVAETSGAWPRDPDTGTEVIGNAAPSLAVASDGAVHMAWQDIDRPTDDQDCSLEPFVCEPPPRWPNTATMWVSRSDDGGVTWSTKTMVRSGDGQAWGPAIAAGPKGELVVTWYDTRADIAGDGEWTGEVWSAHAHDDSPAEWIETRIAGPFDLLTALRSGPGGPITLGNYFGLSAISGGFGAVFSLPSSGAAEAPQDIAFARLSAPGIGFKD